MCEWTPPCETRPSRCTSPPRSFARSKAPHEGRIVEDRAVADGQVHAHQILEQDAARADRQVADLRVAHLPRRQADRLTGGREASCADTSPRAGRTPASTASSTALPGPGRGEAPAVEDDERYEREAAI